MLNRRILYIIGSLEVGGAERHVAQVAMRLKERGWEPEIFVLMPGGPLTHVLNDAGVTIHGVTLPAWVSRVLKNDRLHARVGLVVTSFALICKLWLRRPAVVHFFLPAAYVIGGLASLFARVPARIMSRRSLRNYQAAHPFFARVERYLHPRMTLVCGNSNAVVNELFAEGISAQRLRLTYNGIDLAPYNTPFDRGAARTKAGLPENALVFVLVANLIPYKGHADLIKALARIKKALPEPWLVLCIGRDDGIGADLQQEADSLGVGSNIHFLGSRTDVPGFLRLADVGLLCSHEEGFSNAVLECMAAGLPMVVTNVGGNAEAVLDGVTGYVVPAHNPERLADALLQISLANDRASMGEKGKRRAGEHFSMISCIDAYEALYHETGAGVR
ncbi:glycosyltransferase [Pseudomonas sp. CC6-YY-74]|uniref:glycosyltransferase n=1 Tax=Pseudomonas sp. CC6-YY-74 TaxID=1930532 RepID=UPI0009A199DF|nr:glycosyltransferase [Pseudomonas sp. CC6-YY-74]